MSDRSSILSLPFILPSQAQKHVTHNEAIKALDVLVQLSVLAHDQIAPPVAPVEGACYIVPAGGSSAWSGQDGSIAVYSDGQWAFYAPRAGWRAYVQTLDALIVFDGTAWRELGHNALQNIDSIGIGLTTDPNTPFGAKLNAALWTALYAGDGGNGSMVQTLNKEAATDDLGLVFQTGFSTRALIGLFGSENLRFSVSPDGVSFQDGLIIDKTTGIVDLPNLARFKAYTNFDNYVPADTWEKILVNMAEYNAQGAFDAATGLFTAPVAGTYMLGGTLTYKMNTSTTVRSGGRLIVNGTDELRGSYGEFTASHASERTSLWIQTMASLNAGDTVELQGYMRGNDGYFAAENTSFWGHKVG